MRDKDIDFSDMPALTQEQLARLESGKYSRLAPATLLARLANKAGV